MLKEQNDAILEHVRHARSFLAEAEALLQEEEYIKAETWLFKSNLKARRAHERVVSALGLDKQKTA